MAKQALSLLINFVLILMDVYAIMSLLLTDQDALLMRSRALLIAP